MKYVNLLCLLSLCLISSSCRNNEAALAARKSLRESQTPFSQNSFIKAIADGDKEKVSLFLTAGIDTEIGQHNSNALLVATEHNKKEIVTQLLDNGAEIDPPGFAGTPLCVAATKNYAELVELLIKRGANVNYLQGSINPLILASSVGNVEVVQALLKAGADINTQGESTLFSPLILAARNGHSNVVEELLEKKADSQLESNGGHKALDFAIFKNRIEAAKLLINDPSFDVEDDAPAALVIAIARDYIEILKELISKNPDLNFNYGSLPLLSWAIYNNHTKGAKVLIESGADTTKEDKLHMIPLDYALTVQKKNKQEAQKANAALEQLLKQQKSFNQKRIDEKDQMIIQARALQTSTENSLNEINGIINLLRAEPKTETITK